jgi:GNAT superfamily N-acetyltransferase
MHLIRTNANDDHFVELVKLLDRELAVRDGSEHAFYAQYNKIAGIPHVVVLYESDLPAACGAIKPFSSSEVEVKRMFVRPENRGRGHALAVLSERESWACELGYEAAVLETGKMQPEAIGLYSKAGYRIIPNYGQYAGVEKSVCFRKKLI